PGAANAVFTATNTLALGGGTFQVKGATSGAATSQALGNVTVNAGPGAITLTPQGGGTTTLAAGTLTATAAGGTLLINSPVNATVTFNTAMNTATTVNGRVVLFDGTTYNWAANTGVNTASVGYTAYSALTTGSTNDTNNSLATDAVAMAGSHSTNSLKVTTTTAGQSLDLGTNVLTLTNGGLLFTGANDYAVTATAATAGLKSATATNSDLIVSHYGTGTLTINAAVLQGTGTSTLTVGGTGTVVLGGALGANLNTYTGTTFVNGGTLRVANATRLGAGTGQGLTVNGGTFDLNGNAAFGIGALNGGYAGTVDNTSATPVTLTVGNGNAAGTFLGTIRNSGGGAVSIVKTGTGTLTLGDVNGMSSLAFTGDLSVVGNSGVTAAVGLTDVVGSRVNLGSPTAADAPTFTYAGNANVTFNNRRFSLSDASGGVINGSGVLGQTGTAGVLTINTNLRLDGAGPKSLTLGGTAGNVANGGTVSGMTGSGAVSLINTFAGTIGVDNPNNVVLGLTVAGSGGWALTGANTFAGGLTMNSTGILRGTVGNGAASGSFGGSGNLITWTAAGTLDLRSDTDQNFGNNIAWNAAAMKINVDRAPGGGGYGRVMTLGTITANAATQTLTVQNLNAPGTANQNQGYNAITGYGLRLAGLNLAVGGTTTVNNVMGSPGSATFAMPAVGTGLAGALVIDNVAAGSNLGTTTLTIGASSAMTNGVTIIPGDITQAAGGATPTVLGLTLAGNGTLTLAGTAATNYGGGLSITSTSAVARATTAFSLGTGPVGLAAGTLEVRNDASVAYGNAVNWNGNNNAQINVGEAVNGTGGHGRTFAFGAMTVTTASGKTLTVQGVGGSNNNSGDSVTFAGLTFGAGNLSNTITNNLLLPGVLGLGNVTGAGTAGTSTLTLGGAGVTTLGAVSDGAGGGNLAIAYSGTGVLDLTAAAGGSTFTGGFSSTNAGGTVRVQRAGDLGGATNAYTWTASTTLEVRTDTDVSFPQSFLVGSTNSNVAVGQLPGGTGTTGGYGRTVTLAYVAPTTNAKVLFLTGLGATNNLTSANASSGYSVALTNVDIGGGTAAQRAVAASTMAITNNLLLPGVVTIGRVTNSNVAAGSNVDLLTINGAGYYTLGNAVDGAGTNLTGITYSGTGVLDVGPTTSGNTYTGGFRMTNGTVRASLPSANPFGAAANVVTLAGGTLELRADVNAAVANPLTFTNSAAIALGQLPGGTGST
ncbi:MAG TPA: hypothetical protein VF796_02850, partial [Humisphaera sp.]